MSRFLPPVRYPANRIHRLRKQLIKMLHQKRLVKVPVIPGMGLREQGLQPKNRRGFDVLILEMDHLGRVMDSRTGKYVRYLGENAGGSRFALNTDEGVFVTLTNGEFHVWKPPAGWCVQ